MEKVRGARAGDENNLGSPDPAEQAKPNHLLLLHRGHPGWDSELQVAPPISRNWENTGNKLWERQVLDEGGNLKWFCLSHASTSLFSGRIAPGLGQAIN